MTGKIDKRIPKKNYIKEAHAVKAFRSDLQSSVVGSARLGLLQRLVAGCPGELAAGI